MKLRAGFSLLELLIALAILAAVFSAGYVTLWPLALKSRLQRAAADVATSLQQARSFAQRQNVGASWTRIDDDTYRLTLDTEIVEKDLPGGLRFSLPAAGATISYTAPFGEVDATPKRIRIEGHGYQIEVRVIGVTGKVVRSGVEKIP